MIKKQNNKKEGSKNMKYNKKEFGIEEMKGWTGLPLRTIQRLAKKGMIGRKIGNGITSAYLFTCTDINKKCIREAKKRIRKIDI